MDVEKFSAGTILFREGDEGDTAYLVEKGSIEISSGDGEDRRVLGEIVDGSLFGEMALISSMPRMATATAKIDTICIVIPRKVFRVLLFEADNIMKALVLTLIGHVRSLNEEMNPADDTKSGVEFFYWGIDGVYERVK